MIRLWLLLLAAPLLVGCGTVRNVQGRSYPVLSAEDREPHAFGGIANDVRWAGEQVRRVNRSEDVSDATSASALAGYFALIDLPLSAVGDVVTLPRIVWVSRQQRVTVRDD